MLDENAACVKLLSRLCPALRSRRSPATDRPMSARLRGGGAAHLPHLPDVDAGTQGAARNSQVPRCLEEVYSSLPIWRCTWPLSA